MNRLYIIRNVISRTPLRNNRGEIMVFIHYSSAWDYIRENLPLNLWEVTELRR